MMPKKQASASGNARKKRKVVQGSNKNSQSAPNLRTDTDSGLPAISPVAQSDEVVQSASTTEGGTSSGETSNTSTHKNILVRFYSWVFYPSRNLRTYLLKQIPIVGPSLVLLLLGFKELPKNIPLLEIFNQFPITTPIIGGMLLVVNIAAIAISFGPEPKGLPPGPTANPEIRNQLWKVATIMSTASFLLSTCLLAIVLVRPTWCPPSLCQPVAAVNPNAVRDENLELSLIDVHHTAFMIPGDPVSWSASNLPEKVDAVRIDKSSDVYQIILGVRNLQASRFELLIEKVSLVVDSVESVPYPLNIWNNGSPVNYTTNPYLATYNGQPSKTAFAASYEPVPYAHVHLAAYENDELSVRISSNVTASVRFRMQVTYRFANELQPRSPLLLPNEFEVVFSDEKNWHAYQIQSGVFVPVR